MNVKFISSEKTRWESLIFFMMINNAKSFIEIKVFWFAFLFVKIYILICNINNFVFSVSIDSYNRWFLLDF